jgi:NAD(P)-dependent dehydrogenase (short-subunit alcohol dehydrogenase family)
MRLSGKVAIVTGGARGIGAAIAMCLAEDGAEIAILDLDGEEAARTAASLGVPAIGLAADASDAAAVEAAVATVAD